MNDITSGPPVLAACFDQTFLPHAATLLRSFAASNRRPARWHLIGDPSCTPADLDRLVGFARDDCGLTAEPLRMPDEVTAGFSGLGRYPAVAWYRTALAEALPDEQRLIYLDSDTIVLEDLGDLWATPLGTGDAFGAAAHPSYSVTPGECERLGVPPGSRLLQSGVMLMDLERMRTGNVGGRVREFARSAGPTQRRYAEQDALNILFPGQWTLLDPRWNCTAITVLPFVAGVSWADDAEYGDALERAARSPAIVHFDGAAVLRPWHVRCFHPFAGLYRTFRATTPWPLTRLEGRPRDRLLRHIPPRVQVRIWSVRRRRQSAAAGPRPVTR